MRYQWCRGGEMACVFPECTLWWHLPRLAAKGPDFLFAALKNKNLRKREKRLEWNLNAVNCSGGVGRGKGWGLQLSHPCDACKKINTNVNDILGYVHNYFIHVLTSIDPIFRELVKALFMCGSRLLFHPGPYIKRDLFLAIYGFKGASFSSIN
jgi:hypothetical protein